MKNTSTLSMCGGQPKPVGDSVAYSAASPVLPIWVLTRDIRVIKRSSHWNATWMLQPLLNLFSISDGATSAAMLCEPPWSKPAV